MEKQRTLKQINPSIGYYRTFLNTVWLYPQGDIDKALATTNYQYTYDGTFLTCPNMSNLEGVYNDIY